jgi:predicted alpha/beta-fold hydrolase
VEFDDHYVAPAFGFADARDYYAKASSLPHLSRIRVPTLIVHAQDDPFIPFAPLESALNPQPQSDTSSAVLTTSNENVLLVAPASGGHVAFLSADSLEEDRFWAENRLVDFSEIVAGR